MKKQEREVRGRIADRLFGKLGGPGFVADTEGISRHQFFNLCSRVLAIKKGGFHLTEGEELQAFIEEKASIR